MGKGGKMDKRLDGSERKGDKRKLLHANLVQRVEMEERIMHEAPFCFLFVTALTLMLLSMVYAFDTEKMASVHRLLSDSFELDEVHTVMNAGDVNEALRRYALKQSEFYPASPRFIELDKQSVMQDEIDLFLAPRALPRRLHPRLYESFSLTAWVDGPPKTPLWIARKTQKSIVEATSNDVCWGWQFPGCFAFGQHDAALGNFQEGRPMPETVCTDAPELPGMNLLSMVVNGTHAMFYRNGALLSANPLSRKVTDCDGGIEIGDQGLRLGKVAYYPTALATHELKEIYQDGAPLSELVSGGSKVKTADRLDRLELEVLDARATLSQQQDGVRQEVLDLQSASALTTKESLAVIEQVLALEETETLLLTSANMTEIPIDGSSSSSDIVYSEEPISAICLTGANCTLPNFVNLIKSVHLVLPTSTCGHEEAVAASFEWLTAPVELLRTSALGFIPSTAELSSVILCGSHNSAGSLVDHHHYLGTLTVRAADWAYLLREERTFTQRDGAFFLPDPFGVTDTPDFTVSGWMRQNAENIGFMIGKQYQPTDSVDPISCWGFRSHSITNDIRVEGTTTSGSCPEDICARCYHETGVPIDNAVWRHVAFTVSGATSVDIPGGTGDVTVKQYVDGELQCEQVVTSEPEKPKQCTEDSVITIGTHWRPGDGGMIPFNGDLRDIRMYNRLLSADEVAELSVCADPDVNDDPSFSDAVGHTCSWYDTFQRQYGYSACDSSTKTRCPIACGMVSLCPAQEAEFQIFQRVQKISPPTFCLENDYVSPIAEDCGADEGAGRRRLEVTEINTADDNSSSTSSRRRRLSHIPVPNCETFDDFTDPHCSFDSALTSPLDDISWGEFTMYFWTKGTNMGLFAPTSFSEEGSMTHCFEIFHEVLWAYNPATGTWGNARPETTVGADEWLMRALVVNSTHFSYFFNGEFVSTEFDYECHDLVGLYFGPRGFNAEAETMLHSPFKFYMRALPPATLTAIYYGELAQYNDVLSTGPIRTNDVRNTEDSTEIEQYAEKTMSFLPPVVFQERFKLVECDGFSKHLQTRFGEIAGEKCTWPYICTNLDAVQDSLIKCIDRSNVVESEGSHFGRDSSTFLDQSVWSEFLQIFDGNVLVRDGKSTSPSAFIDMRTKTLSMVAVFYTPNAETVSLMTVEFDMSLPSVRGSASISHYPSIAKSKLWSWRTINGAAIFFAVLQLAFTLWSDANDGGIGRRSSENEEGARMGDELLAIIIIVYLCVQAYTFPATRANIQDTFGDLLNMQWSAQDIDYSTKVEMYFENVESAKGLIDNLNTVENIGFVLAFVGLGRIVQYLAIHPRIRILPGVISHAAHEVLSFSQYAALLYLVIAILASYMFAFATWQAASMSQFNAILGNTDDFYSVSASSNNHVAVALYLFSFTGFILFMLVNLFLAIIVDSYMATKKALSSISKECSKSFVADCVAIAHLVFNKYAYGWPDHSVLTKALEEMVPDEDGWVSECDFNAVAVLRMGDAGEPSMKNPMSETEGSDDEEDGANDNECANPIFGYYRQFSFLRQKANNDKEQEDMEYFRFKARYVAEKNADAGATSDDDDQD